MLRESHQFWNEQHGFYCYYDEENPRSWSLWRESDDTALTPWLDLGPDGMIWVIWNAGDEYVLVLEERDDAADPPVLRQALMHLPSGRQTEFAFAGDRDFDTSVGITTVNMGSDDLLMLACPSDILVREEVLGAALYDKDFRELVGPCIGCIHPCWSASHCVELGIRQPDMTVLYGVFDYLAGVYLVPAAYKDVATVATHWYCNRHDGSSDIRNQHGELISSHPYLLHKSDDDDKLYAERDGLWGWAALNGELLVEPYAADVSALLAEAVVLRRLRLTATVPKPLVLDQPTLDALVELVGEAGTCIKYEGIPRESGGDGMLDIGRAELSKGASALLLEDRWENTRFLVLTSPWQNLPAGTVLALSGKSQVETVPEEGEVALFLDCVFAQSIDWL